jgi:hypothetical protein
MGREDLRMKRGLFLVPKNNGNLNTPDDQENPYLMLKWVLDNGSQTAIDIIMGNLRLIIDHPSVNAEFKKKEREG